MAIQNKNDMVKIFAVMAVDLNAKLLTEHCLYKIVVPAVPGGAGLGAVVPGRAHQRHAVQPLPVEDLVLRHGVAEVGARGPDLHNRDPGLQVKTYHRGR